MITQQQLAQAWNTFSEKMTELRKRRQEIVAAYDKQKSQEKILELHRKMVDIPED